MPMSDMRLSKRQIASIKNAVVEVLGPEAQVWLFGSRVDDSAKGGDIDLLVRPDPTAGNPDLMGKVRLLGKLERALGERRIDIVIETPRDPRPIVRIAHEKGIPL
jgi:predicted nucleotidyltransferase